MTDSNSKKPRKKRPAPKKPRGSRRKSEPGKKPRSRKPAQSRALVPQHPIATAGGGDDEKPKRGRKPKLEPDGHTLGQIRNLAALQCTQAEAAGVLEVAFSTFRAFLKEHPEAKEAWDDGMLTGKASLRRLQYKLAATKPAMAIWLGKQWLDQKDKLQHSNDPNAPFVPIVGSMTPKEAAEAYAGMINGGAGAGS